MDWDKSLRTSPLLLVTFTEEMEWDIPKLTLQNAPSSVSVWVQVPSLNSVEDLVSIA
jgi:hypothetical protein